MSFSSSKIKLTVVIFLTGFFLFPKLLTAQSETTYEVLIQGGKFIMGDPKVGTDAQPPHRVSVDDFFICRYEVSQLEYELVMKKNPPLEMAKIRRSDNHPVGKSFPVYYVTWYDAINFCNRKSHIDGLNPCYHHTDSCVVWDRSANGYRLPTEAEWEYVARQNFIGQDSTITTNPLERFAHEKVLSGKPNSAGIFHLLDNVWEWCWDQYDFQYYEQCKQMGDVHNPVGPITMKETRVFRGGSWYYSSIPCLIAYRNFYPPKSSRFNLGFRIVRNATETNHTSNENTYSRKHH